MSQSAPDASPAVGSTAPDPKRWRALFVIAMAQLMVILDASIVNIALPSAQRDLGISDSDRQWVVTAYTLAFGGLLLLGGRIADYWGRKRTFMLGLLGFAFASALGGLAPNAGLLFGARALQGVFAALLAPAALSLITVTFTESKERAKAFGVYGGISGGGAAIGLIVGGILTEYASWRWCLLVNVPFALITIALAIPFVHESKAHGDTSYDIPGAVTATLGLVSLVYGITKAGTDGWTDSVTLTFFAAALVLLISFVVIESRTRNPLLPLRIVENRNRGGSYLTMFMTAGGLFAMFLLLSYYFQAVLGYSALKSGFAFLPFSLGIIVSAGLASQMLPRFGPRPLVFGGLVSATVGMLWLTQLDTTAQYATMVLPAEVLMSLGLGFVFVSLAATALFGVSPHDAGVASGLLNTTQQIGGSLGIAVMNTIAASATTAYLNSHGPTQLQAATVHGFSVAFALSAVVLGAAAIVGLFLINADRHSLAQHDVEVPAAT
ncbi:MAG TPA: MFS transporter [Actinomycetes bacterium]|nr:MFS transporter [Actinomycetes bacterium]